MKKRIIVNSYKIYNRKIKANDIKIVHISDIHFSSITDFSHLKQLKDKIDVMKPNYICITGDIIDCLKFINDEERIEIFYKWIHNLGNREDKVIPVLISLGNHDMVYKPKEEKYNKSIYNKYLKKLSSTNTYILDDSYYEDDNVVITGFTQPPNTFHSKNSLKQEKKYFDNIKPILLKPSIEKINIALIHSPINIVNKYIVNKLKDYDIVLSGHMHNGMVMPFIDKIFKGNFGIIDPNKKWFPKIARGRVVLEKNKYLIISGGITKLSWCSGIFHYGNFIYPMHIENIIFTNIA